MQQHITAQQATARSKAQHYDESCEFMGMFEAGSFDEEVEDSTRWLGLTRDDTGILQVYAEFVYDDADKDSGIGWWL